MSKKGIELPMAFIVFLIVVVIIFAVILIWNFYGVEFFSNATDTVNENIIENISSGRVSLS